MEIYVSRMSPLLSPSLPFSLLRAKMEMMLLRRDLYTAAHMPLVILPKDLKIKVLR